MTLRFGKIYLVLALLLLAAEIAIAVFVRDRVIRPFVGDVLIVVLIYCCLRIFLNVNYRTAAMAVLSLAVVIEILQLFDFVARLGLETNRALAIALGRTFDWLDLLAYLIGFALIVAAEKFYERHRTD